jgi:PPOX class probable F420-dependent enzyme
MADAFNQFVHQRTILLTTYRRDGTPVGTPVNIVVDGGRAFVRTFDTAWKLKRIRNNPTVEVAIHCSRQTHGSGDSRSCESAWGVRKPITRAAC